LDNEFGCNNGSCIPLDGRCNGAKGCNEIEDELHCDTVVIDEVLYHKEKPPLNSDEQLTNVTVIVTVLSLSNFNEIEMTFAAKFIVQMEW
jgi:hypothetical protein